MFDIHRLERPAATNDLQGASFRLRSQTLSRIVASRVPTVIHATTAMIADSGYLGGCKPAHRSWRACRVILNDDAFCCRGLDTNRNGGLGYRATHDARDRRGLG